MKKFLYCINIWNIILIFYILFAYIFFFATFNDQIYPLDNAQSWINIEFVTILCTGCAGYCLFLILQFIFPQNYKDPFLKTSFLIHILFTIINLIFALVFVVVGTLESHIWGVYITYFGIPFIAVTLIFLLVMFYIHIIYLPRKELKKEIDELKNK